MATAVINVVALVAELALGVLQILPLIEGSGPQGPQSIVRIGIGLYNSSDKLGGDVPGVTLWNEDGKRIGKVQNPGHRVEAGSFVDIPVPQSPANQQPTYVKVEGRSDSICIAYIGHAWPDGTKRGWLGDIGKSCDRQFYYSNVYVTQVNGTQHKPFCTWIGGTGAAANWTTQMTIHTPEFSSVGSANDFSIPADPSSLCRAPATTWSSDPVASSGSMRRPSLFGVFSLFSMLSRALEFTEATSQGTISAPESPFQSTIVGSHYVRHNSTALCSNPMSYGPDFVSFHEGVFCDMATRRTRKLCSNVTKYDCYDWDTHTMVDRKLRKRKLAYRDVHEWK